MAFRKRHGKKKRSPAAKKRRMAKKSFKRRVKRGTVFRSGNFNSGTSMLATSRLVKLNLVKTWRPASFSENSYAATEVPFNITDISDLEDQLTSDFGTAVDVPGYSLMTTLYQRYCVVGFKCVARIIDRSGPSEAGATWNAEDAYGHGYVIDQKDLSSGTYPVGYEYGQLDDMMTHKYGNSKIETGIDISVRKTAPITTCKWSCKKYFNCKDVKDNQQLYGGTFKTAAYTSGALNTQKSAVRYRSFQIPMWNTGMDAHPMRWQVEYKVTWIVLCTMPNDRIGGL